MRQNNFDVLRLGAALGVFMAHGSLFYDLQISSFFNGVYSIGSLSVYVFFFVSGYLNFQSWNRGPQWASFGTKRALRIFPGLLVAAFVSVFVIGGLMTTLDLTDFLASEQTWVLFLNYASALATQNDLPGVFANNPIPHAVNGSLWTIKYEVMMYVLLVVFGMAFGLSRRLLVAAVVVSAAAFLLVKDPSLDEGAVTWRDFWQFAAIFFAGAAFNYLPVNQRHWVIPPMLVGFVIACTGTNLAVVQGGVFLCLPCAVFLLAYWRPLTRIRLRHDLSYGIYIYAFPVQQAIAEISLRHGISKPSYMAMALGLVLLLALASWIFIERPAIAWSRSLVTSFHRHLVTRPS
ncbi:acyltransferase family protein [Comamonas sediminis]|uniref:Acyltransferase family protein n=1 Tax=Comamonas sediminis TaxID=1783360 RepID=A0ABV4B1Z3_9BURK